AFLAERPVSRRLSRTRALAERPVAAFAGLARAIVEPLPEALAARGPFVAPPVLVAARLALGHEGFRGAAIVEMHRARRFRAPVVLPALGALAQAAEPVALGGAAFGALGDAAARLIAVLGFRALEIGARGLGQ